MKIKEVMNRYFEIQKHKIVTEKLINADADAEVVIINKDYLEGILFDLEELAHLYERKEVVG